MDGIAWAASAMVAARERLDIATGDLANVSTDGFIGAVAHGKLTPAGVRVTAAADRGPRGALRRTGRDFDFAIVGDGAFVVADATGKRSQTRAGAFSRERDGTLRDAFGRTLMAGGRPLRVSENADAASVVARVPLPAGSSIRSGFLESANVDAIHEMIDVMSAERSFETAQKIVSAIDRTREKSSGDVARVK